MSSTDPIVDIDRVTGEFIQGWPRCKQSILVILTTRLRTRVMRRWFGSSFLNLLDMPGNEQTFNECLGAAVVAINKYEPEFKITRLSVRGPIAAGEVVITIEGTYLPDQTARRTVFAV